MPSNYYTIGVVYATHGKSYTFRVPAGINVKLGERVVVGGEDPALVTVISIHEKPQDTDKNIVYRFITGIVQKVEEPK